MHDTGTPRRLWIAVILSLLAAAPAAAQPSLEARMRAFVHAAAEEHVDSVVAFFPRRGTWSWVVTTHGSAPGDRVGVWRFDAAQTLDVIQDGPACQSFMSAVESVRHGALIYRLEAPWRRVRGYRFVPAGASAASPLFVQWRREDGRWVVSAYGDEQWRRPRLLGVGVGEGRRDTTRNPPLTDPIAEDGPHVGRARWFVDGVHYIKYGLPRPLRPGDVTRVGWYDGVALHAETGEKGVPEVLYLATGPGFEFQPYQALGSPPCYDPALPARER